MASAAVTALVAALATEIAKLDDDLAKADAAVALERYGAALENQASVEAGGIQSYTIAGRSITRRNLAEGEKQLAQLRAAVLAYVRGEETYVGMGGYA